LQDSDLLVVDSAARRSASDPTDQWRGPALMQLGFEASPVEKSAGAPGTPTWFGHGHSKACDGDFPAIPPLALACAACFAFP